MNISPFVSRSRWFPIIALIAFLTGCKTTNQFAQPRVLKNSKVAEVAKRYAAEQLHLTNPEVEKNKTFFGHGYYTVVVWHDVREGRSFVIIDLSKDLEILGWQPAQ